MRGLGTRNRLLRYGICMPCKKQPPVVRDAFSEAFGVKNRLLRYGRDIRCQKQPPLVRDASSKARRTASCSTECIFESAKTASCHTERIFKGPQNSRLHRLWTASCRGGRSFSARNGSRSEVIRLKRGCIPWKCLRIHPRFS